MLGYECRIGRKEKVEWVVHYIMAGFPICKGRFTWYVELPEGAEIYICCKKCLNRELDRLAVKYKKVQTKKLKEFLSGL